MYLNFAKSADDDRSIAVLPFANISANEDDAFFTKGVHEDIITRLAGLKDLKVISRTSVMAFGGGEASLREIGERLGARYIVEGSVQRSEDQVRVTAKLVEATTDQNLWSQSYDRELVDVFCLRRPIDHCPADRGRTQGEDQSRRAGRPGHCPDNSCGGLRRLPQGT
jgi:TolB-like protein